MEEEEARVKASWMQWDEKMYAAAFGSKDVLEKYVAAPGSFIAARKGLVIGMSDQIPVWVKIGRGKQVYSASEVQKRKTSEDFKEMQKKLKSEEATTAGGVSLVGPVQALKGTEDSTLTRTTGDSSAEKFRITYEARQIIMKNFQGEEVPEGFVWQGALVVKGVHGRLSNISLGGAFLLIS